MGRPGLQHHCEAGKHEQSEHGSIYFSHYKTYTVRRSSGNSRKGGFPFSSPSSLRIHKYVSIEYFKFTSALTEFNVPIWSDLQWPLLELLQKRACFLQGANYLAFHSVTLYILKVMQWQPFKNLCILALDFPWAILYHFGETYKWTSRRSMYYSGISCTEFIFTWHKLFLWHILACIIYCLEFYLLFSLKNSASLT